MNTARALPSPILAACLLAACGPTGGKAPAWVDTAKIVDEIKSDEVRWNGDYKSGEPGKVAAHFSSHATLMAPGEPPAAGAPAIEAAVRRLMDDPGFNLAFSSDEVRVAASGDLAASRGRYTLTLTDPATHAATTTEGTFITVYRPQPGGAWKAVWDIATPGPARAAGAPAP